jgi:hypothetical protein
MLDSFSSFDTPFAALALAPVPNDVTRCGTKKVYFNDARMMLLYCTWRRKWKWKQLATNVHGMPMNVKIGVKQNAHGMADDGLKECMERVKQRHQGKKLEVGKNRLTLTTRVTSFL